MLNHLLAVCRFGLVHLLKDAVWMVRRSIDFRSRQETTKVCHAVLEDPAFFRFLLRIDEEFAAKTRRGACRSRVTGTARFACARDDVSDPHRLARRARAREQ